MKRPRIVIPEIFREVSNYTKAMYAAGLDPVVVSVQSIQAEKGHQKEYIDYLEINPRSYDGLLLPGGDDINPEAYGEENCGERQTHKYKDLLPVARRMQVLNSRPAGMAFRKKERIV